jgi:hypothetical protein
MVLIQTVIKAPSRHLSSDWRLKWRLGALMTMVRLKGADRDEATRRWFGEPLNHGWTGVPLQVGRMGPKRAGDLVPFATSAGTRSVPPVGIGQPERAQHV